MLICQDCKAEIPEGSPEMKVCPYCGEPKLKFVEVQGDEKKTSQEKEMGEDRSPSFGKKKKILGGN